MRYAFYDLGEQPQGATAVVRLRGTAPNVLLLDEFNFGRYRSGGGFVYTGGHFTSSPVQLEVPHDDHWYVVVDFGGFRGRVRGKVKVLPPGEKDSGAHEALGGRVPAGA